MRLILALAAIAAGLGAVNGDDCAKGSSDTDGNWFCQSVQAIHYSNVGTAGTYQKLMDMSGGSCTSEPYSFEGPISPLNEEVSVHIRGPFALKQFAAYNMASSSTSSAISQPTSDTEKAKKHLRGHQQFHARKRGKHDQEKRDDIVTATIDGQVDHWVNNWFGPGTPVTTPPSAPVPTETGDSATDGDHSSSTASYATGTYVRIGYYNSANGISENLTFIGNYGGAGSGVFDETFGASAAYLNSAGTGGASSSKVLSDTTIPSDKEFAIFTSNPCIAGDSCGYVRPGSVAYHGFSEANKIFMFEFSMPSDGTTGFNADMPALWLLNAQIPRTLQYGEASCSCWTTGCGEFDIMEILSSGSMFAKSTLHTNTPAGDSDYIMRPVASTMKLAVVFHSPMSAIRIQVLPDSYDFGVALSESDVKTIMSMTAKGSQLSEFKVTA